MTRARIAAAVAALLVVGACTSTPVGASSPPAPGSRARVSDVAVAGTSAARPSTATVPRPKRIVVVMMENHSYADVIGNSSAPFINSLAESGALFTRSFGVTHPSEPNYVALFSGSTHGLTSDSCPHSYSGPNLGAEVRSVGRRFVGYSEGLPHAGFTGCTSGLYVRRHAPWINFASLPAGTNQPFTSFPHTYAQLPSLSFVIPDLNHDMHNGTIAQGDHWLHVHLAGYAHWARSHDSLLVVTWDEDDYSEANQIPTIIAGAYVTPGRYREQLTHYRLLRTLTACLGVPAIGASKTVQPVTDIWHH